MLNILSIVIGLIFVILLMSILASTVHDVFASMLSLRGKNLRSTLQNMLGERADDFFKHPFFQQLTFAEHHQKGEKPYSLPDWITKETFSAVLHDQLSQSEKGGETLADKIAHIEDPKLRRLLEYLARQSDGTVGGFKNKTEHWFEEVMQRSSNWYARATKWRLLGIGTALAFMLNADTIGIYQRLSVNAELREQLVKEAEILVKKDTLHKIEGKTPEEKLKNTEAFFDQNLKKYGSGLGLGWNDDRSKENLPNWLTKIVGILLMGIAVTFGASFWFDLLKKILSVRSGLGGGGGSAGEKSEAPKTTEKSEARKNEHPDDQKPVGQIKKPSKQKDDEKAAEKAVEKARIIAADQVKKPVG